MQETGQRTPGQAASTAPNRDPSSAHDLDHVAISVLAHRRLDELLAENPPLERILRNSRNETEALVGVKHWALSQASVQAQEFYEGKTTGRRAMEALEWRDFATIRLLDYVDHAGLEYVDLNLRGQVAVNNPIRMMWLAVARGTGGAKPAFFEDMIQLFRQLGGRTRPELPGRSQVLEWMGRYPSGLDPRIVHAHQENKDRILRKIIAKIDAAPRRDARYAFDAGASEQDKLRLANEWWHESKFHLKFAVRTADDLNDMLGQALDPDTLAILQDAEAAGIPIFVNPYYLSLLLVRVPYFANGADLAIRQYILHSRELVEEFGHIVAWEKEDLVEPGKPNAAGWILPSHHNVHRRYPEVAILIPDTVGRACGGLCASCQRMYDFQRGNLNFDLERLRPKETWKEKLERLLVYFEQDAQLRDILVTGGDALMSTDQSLQTILDGILRMAERKKAANQGRPEGARYAELLRVRLGSRLPAYLPQRVTEDLIAVLRDFKAKAAAVGVRQFVIQTHFESPLEVTPESRQAVQRLLEAGWIVTNQLVFTAAASRRGHTAKLRAVLNDIGVLPYYTFTVKGYMENHHNFATNARIVQEQLEEKVLGRPPTSVQDELTEMIETPAALPDALGRLRTQTGLPFVALDRSVLNLPGVGKSLTFRVIGITRYGRRILEFDHDPTRTHSPIVDRLGKMVIIESKSVPEYLQQLAELGEDPAEYEDVFGYSLGETEPRSAIYEYPSYDFEVTPELTQLDLGA